MDCRKILAGLTLTLLCLSSSAQFRLPAFDVSLKTGYMFMPDDYKLNDNRQNVTYDYENLWAQGEISLHFGQRLAFGGYYNRSLVGGYANHDSDQAQDAEHLMYGALLRFSSGRSVKVRPYVQLKYFNFQMVVHESGYEVATQCSGATAGAGLMIRLSNKVYLNIPDIEFGSLFNTGDVLFRDSTVILKVGTGLTYNFSRRK